MLTESIQYSKICRQNLDSYFFEGKTMFSVLVRLAAVPWQSIREPNWRFAISTLLYVKKLALKGTAALLCGLLERGGKSHMTTSALSYYIGPISDPIQLLEGERLKETMFKGTNSYYETDSEEEGYRCAQLARWWPHIIVVGNVKVIIL